MAYVYTSPNIDITFINIAIDIAFGIIVSSGMKSVKFILHEDTRFKSLTSSWLSSRLFGRIYDVVSRKAEQMWLLRFQYFISFYHFLLTSF